jgi:hypothetical protein
LYVIKRKTSQYTITRLLCKKKKIQYKATWMPTCQYSSLLIIICHSFHYIIFLWFFDKIVFQYIYLFSFLYLFLLVYCFFNSISSLQFTTFFLYKYVFISLFYICFFWGRSSKRSNVWREKKHEPNQISIVSCGKFCLFNYFLLLTLFVCYPRYLFSLHVVT